MSSSQAKIPKTILVLRVIAESPANGFYFFQAAEAGIEDEPNEADDQHGGHYQVVTFAGVPRIDNQVAQAGIDGNHFRGYHDKPGDAQRDAQADDDLWKGGGEDHLGQQAEGAEAEVTAGEAEHGRDVGYTIDAGHDDGEKGSQKDERGGCVVAYAEQDDGDGNPGDGADGAKNLEDRIHDVVGCGIPT